MKPLLLLCLLISPHLSLAQDSQGGGSYRHEFGLNAGPFLPSRIPFVYDTLLGWGARYGLRTGKGQFELDNLHFRSTGVVYNSTSLDFRLDFSNPVLSGAHIATGAHVDYYKGRNLTRYRAAPGWHWGGGVQFEIAGPVWLRFDFRHRFGPGRSLYVGTGIVLRFKDSGSSSSVQGN